MSAAIDRVLDRLDGVRRNGEGRYMTRCPAHDDRRPSLSVRDAETRVLLHCFAGCETEDVLAALGLGWRDLFEEER
jgi:DNA primase